MKQDILVVVLLGETGSGKDFLKNKLMQGHGFKPLVSCTTRPMRQGERNGVDYHFMTEERYFAQDGELTASRSYYVANGDVWHYGLKKPNKSGKYVVILDKKGYEQFKTKVPCIGIYISVFDEVERYFRALDRLGDEMLQMDNKELYRRIKDDKIQFEGIHDIVDFTIPQLYTEITFAILEEKLKMKGFIQEGK